MDTLINRDFLGWQQAWKFEFTSKTNPKNRQNYSQNSHFFLAKIDRWQKFGVYMYMSVYFFIFGIPTLEFFFRVPPWYQKSHFIIFLHFRLENQISRFQEWWNRVKNFTKFKFYGFQNTSILKTFTPKILKPPQISIRSKNSLKWRKNSNLVLKWRFLMFRINSIYKSAPYINRVFVND